MAHHPRVPELSVNISSANPLGKHHQNKLGSLLSAAPCNTPSMQGTIQPRPSQLLQPLSVSALGTK